MLVNKDEKTIWCKKRVLIDNTLFVFIVESYFKKVFIFTNISDSGVFDLTKKSIAPKS
jgi:hypothetical protein